MKGTTELARAGAARVALAACALVVLPGACSEDDGVGTAGSAGSTADGGGPWAGSSGASGATGAGGQADGGGVGGSAGADGGVGDAAGAAGANGGSSGAPGNGTVGPTISQFTPSGPIVLQSGQTVEGLSITTDSGPCIRGDGVSNVHILNNRIGPCGPDETGIGIALEGGGSDIHIEHNAIDDVASGFYRVGGGNNIVFDHNYVTRVRGPFPRGQMVQFNEVSGEGNRIVCNVSDQTTPGYGDGPEDHISPFYSSGTQASPLLIAYNKLRGGGPSTSGGGILAGDHDGEYVEIRGNILVHPGQYGLAIAGGRNHKMIDNIVYAPTSYPWSNNGLFVWGQYEEVAACSGHEVHGNRVHFIDKNGDPNAGWNAGNCGVVAGWSDNVFDDPSLTLDVWDTVIPECQ